MTPDGNAWPIVSLPKGPSLAGRGSRDCLKTEWNKPPACGQERKSFPWKRESRVAALILDSRLRGNGKQVQRFGSAGASPSPKISSAKGA